MEIVSVPHFYWIKYTTLKPESKSSDHILSINLAVGSESWFIMKQYAGSLQE